MPCTTPPFDLGFKRAARLDVPDGKVLDAMVDFSDTMRVMGLRRWRPTHAAGLARHRWSPDDPHAPLANAQATAAVQRWLETPECPEGPFPSLRQSFLQGWQFFLMSRSARLR